MIKEKLKEVEKVWGGEIWLVNCKEYCSKLLIVDKDAVCSYHYHPKKKETFFALEGKALLTVEDKDYTLTPFTRAKTILPGEKHKFKGITEAVILEVSTHHEEEDVVRLSNSQPKQQDS